MYKTIKNFYKDPIMFYGALFLIFILVQIIYVYSTRFERVITIKEKHDFSSGKHIRNTISDEEGNVYQITSSYPLLHFTDAEIWLNIEKNKKYTILAYGWRIPILQLYPNIVAIV